jgi:carboxypeptidase C (cathepsin A)
MRHALTFFALAAVLAVTPLFAQHADRAAHHEEDKQGSEEAKHDGDKAKPDPEAAVASAVEDAQPKHGTVTTASGRKIEYTVTPGTLTIRDDAGDPIASMFYVGYVANRAKGDERERPVTFLFNGGPGSSSMWLHMGSWGPVRVDTPTATAYPSAPFHIGENRLTLLDDSDLVFVDAVGTGLSRPIGKAKGEGFYGVDPDIDAFARAIQRYLTLNDRWNSPKFVYGESYGTLRAAGLVLALQQRGIQTNGVVLQSSILNYGARQPGFNIGEIRFLPSYAATAWYHNRLPNRPAALEPFLTEVREWTRGPYMLALAQGDNLSDQDRQKVAQQMSAYTGLPVPFLLSSDLRVNLNRFRKELLRDQRGTIGRLDSRFVGTDVDAAGEQPDYDVTDTSMSGPYVAALNKYLFGTLGYKTKLTYRPTFYQEIGGGHWDQKHKGPNGQNMALAATSLDLAVTMRENPHLKVLSLNGYYDMATPFFGAEWDLAQMQIAPALRKNIAFRYYESGHMIYIAPEAMGKMKHDLDQFYSEATSGN